nr:hypothetical protein HK105_005520 [Polyrhizophydium stewartii]
MKRCVMLAALHFVFGVSYSAASLLAVEKNVALVVFLAIPLGLTMMGFYTWFFTGLMRTMQTLELRRQSVKLLMYKRLGYILTGSAIAIFVIAIANSINISHRNDPQWVASQWRWRWMLLDGSMNIVYFVVFVLIAVLWRPTENNQRYGLDQLAQDDPDEEMSHGIRLRDVTQPSDDFDEFDEDFGGLQADEFESADEVLKWVEQNVAEIQTAVRTAEGNVGFIRRTHERSLTAFSAEEQRRLQAELDNVQNETRDLLADARRRLQRIAAETKQMRERGQAAGDRQAAVAQLASKVVEVADAYRTVQETSRKEYRQRMEREIRVANPNATPDEIERALDSNSGSVFAQQLLSSRIGEQRRVLQEVQGRHEELRKMEQSIVELAQLFQDMQAMIEAQSSTIVAIETNVMEAQTYLERGNQEVDKAIVHQESYNKNRRMVLIASIVIVIVLIIIIAAYFGLKKK